MSKQELADELHKNYWRIITEFRKRELYSSFKDNIWSSDLADMQLINKFNKGFCFLQDVIDICSKYAWIVPLKDKNGITITNASKEFRWV